MHNKNNKYDFEFNQSIKRGIRDLELGKKHSMEEVLKHFYKKSKKINNV